MNTEYKVNRNILYSENRRAIKSGLIGNITNDEFNKWCISWWIKNGLDSNGEKNNDGILRDPYTGYEIDSNIENSRLVLEHIIPIDRGGGTIIFNVVPSRADTNSSKSNSDPLEWWLKSGFFNRERFLTFVKYIFASYDKKIDDGLFNNSNDTLIEILNFSSDGTMKNKDFGKYSIQLKNKTLLDTSLKINYSHFLSLCVVIVEQIDKDVATIYRKKLISYEEKGIFKNIGLSQNLQSIIFKKIKELDSSLKYTIVKKIDMKLLINSMQNVENLENEINNRINNLMNIINSNRNSIKLVNLLLYIPNLLCYSVDEINLKIDIIKNLNLSQNILTVIKNNSFLLSMPPDEIISSVHKMREALGLDYFNIFINTSFNLEEIKIFDYIKKCNKSSQLKNLRKQNSRDNFDFWLKNNTNIKLLGTFLNTLSANISNRSYSITQFDETIDQINISMIIKSLYSHIKNNLQLLNNSEQLKMIIYNIIQTVSSDAIDNMKIIGENEDEKKDNILKLFYGFVDNNMIQNYFYLEIVKNEKLRELELMEFNCDVDVVKAYIMSAKKIDDLSNEKLNLITTKLSSIGLLNGTFISRANQRMRYIKNSSDSLDNKRQLYVANDVRIITNQLLEKVNFTDEVNVNYLKNITLNLIKAEMSINSSFFEQLNELPQSRKLNMIIELFNKEIDNGYLQNYLMLEQLLRQKRNEISQRNTVENTAKERLKHEKERLIRISELKKIIDYIDQCSNINQLRFENIDKYNSDAVISLNEWINMNIDLNALNLNNLKRSFEDSLIEKIRSGSSVYSKKNVDRKLIKFIVKKINSHIISWNDSSIETQKTLVNMLIENILYDNESLSLLDNYKGNTYEEKANNFKSMIYKFIDDGTIETYLLLDQKVKQKIQQFNFINDNHKTKRSA